MKRLTMPMCAAALLVSAVTLSPCRAQGSGQSLADRLREADELYRADKLLQAEAMYRQLLDRGTTKNRRDCFKRLLAIYARVGRLDQAVQTGLTYAEWLRKGGEHVLARELALDLGRWYYDLGHTGTAATYLRRALAELTDAPLPPARQVTALTYLALAAEKASDRKRAGQAWREVEDFARGVLDDATKALDAPARIECVRRLADSYRYQKRPREAIPQLEGVLPVFDKLKDARPGGKAAELRRDTLRQLAEHLTAADRHADAAKRLREALALHEEHAASDLLTRADLSCELAEALERQGLTKDAAERRQHAIKDYQAVLKNPRAGRPEAAGGLAAFWKLQALYQRRNQYTQALKLTQDQAAEWGWGLTETRLQAEEGRLQIFLGIYGSSRKLLAAAVHELEKQSPLNLVELPAAFLNLGVAELAIGSRAAAEKAGKSCRDLYRKHRLADDLVLVGAYDLLGTCAAHEGKYNEGIKLFREGAAVCARLGPTADPQHCNLLLNVARLHKLQYDLGQAGQSLRAARKVYQRFPSPDAHVFAALDAAEAALLAAQTKLDAAHKLAGQVLAQCDKLDVRKGPLVITARHCQALFHLYDRNLDAAEKAWLEVAKLHGSDSPLQPRTLNYLALTSECRQQFDKAEALYRKALALQQRDPRAFPVTHFTTLWRLANVVDRTARHAEARALLQKAITVAERARLQPSGADEHHASYFAQFVPALDQLVSWCVRDGDVAGAVVAVARGRSRTLVDQLLMANVDPRQGLRGKEAERLLADEKKLLQEIATLRARGLLIAPEARATEKARQLEANLREAQKQYAKVYRDILDASPVYAALAPQEFTVADLDRLRKRAVGPRRLLLVYHVGREQSHLLLLGDRKQPPEAFALTVSAEVAARVAAPPPLPLAAALKRGRGIALQGLAAQPELPPPPARGATVPLGAGVLRALVQNYLVHIQDEKFRPARGLRLQPRDPTRPLPSQRPELFADILLPPAVRARIRALTPECLIVVPDGALHKLPFEALLLRAGEQPVYVLDELPPLVYAPAVAGLALLADRPSAALGGLKSLLSVADPVYPQGLKEKAQGGPRQGEPPPATPTAVLGQLEPLPHTAKEAAQISGYFAGKQVKCLQRLAATKKALKAELRGRHVVHIAAHGFADDGFANLFGGLVLTPPPPGHETLEDDGFLSLHEICRLPLQDCELAVLSACETNVGPQRALEAGLTLANGFLGAGARRVVASQWNVNDESTAVLMSAFFKEVQAGGGTGVYARALQQARRQLRHRAEWSAPYYWAPFVLIGPAD